VLCPGDGEGSTSDPRVSSRSYKGYSWQGKTDVPRAPPYPFQAPGGQRKVVLLPSTPGDRAGEVGASGASCSGGGGGVPHSQDFVQDWIGSCQQDTLGIWGLQRARPEGAGTELGVELGELDTEPVGSQSEGLITG